MAEIIKKNLFKATFEYYLRKIRYDHPAGNFDRQGRWYPADAERTLCCDNIRQPSSAYPYSLMTHCRSIKHIATKYSIEDTQMKIIKQYTTKYSNLFTEFKRLNLIEFLRTCADTFTEFDIIGAFVEKEL